MTEGVFWPHEKAMQPSQDRIEVTVVAWDYEQKRGTALLPGGHFVEVRQVTALTVIGPEQKESRT